MDKEHISIDEFVRQRLGDRREPDMPDWSKMRALLDEQMPERRRRFAGGWKNFLYLSLVLVTVSGLTIGYRLHSDAPAAVAQENPSAHPDNAVPANGHAAVAATPVAYTAPAPDPVVAHHAARLKSAIDASHSEAAPATHEASASAPSAAPAANPSNASIARVNRPAPVSSALQIAVPKATPAAQNPLYYLSPMQTQPLLASVSTGLSRAMTYGDPQSAFLDELQSVPTARYAGFTQSAPDQSAGYEPGAVTVSEAAAELPVASNTASFTPAAPARLNNAAAPARSNAGGTISIRVKESNPTPAPAAVDSVRMLSVSVHRETDPVSRRSVYKADTDYRNVAIARTSGEPVPQAAAPSLSAQAGSPEANSELVPLSNYRVATEKAHSASWKQQSRFNEMVFAVKDRMTHAQFFTGVTGGVSTTLLNGAMPGFQIGLNGHIVFDDRWSLMTEARFHNRFNNGTGLDDQSVKTVSIDDQTVNGVRYLIYKREQVTNHYSAPSYTSLDLPVMLRCEISRFFVTAGLNAIYRLALNIEKTATTETVEDRRLYTAAAPEEIGMKLTDKDFESRFGFGYIVGAGYQLSPALSLDLRVTQQLSDNASGYGQNYVSKQLYAAPTAQFSFSYRFGKRRKY